MASKQVTLAVGAVLFTAINLLVLAANWSITPHAKVAGMNFSAPSKTVWVAVGDYRGERIEVKGSSASNAAKHWANAARSRGN
jgi:hypothetical protein